MLVRAVYYFLAIPAELIRLLHWYFLHACIPHIIKVIPISLLFYVKSTGVTSMLVDLLMDKYVLVANNIHKNISQFWLAKSSAIFSKYSVKKWNTFHKMKYNSHRGQANFSACLVWMHTQSNITNIFLLMHNLL